ncbi:MAG: ion transporter [Phycisphaerales bacterium]|nr:ion transporter [Phycisphaerales bacterium]
MRETEWSVGGGGLVHKTRRLVDAAWFHWVITGLIILAAVLVGLETSVTVMSGYSGIVVALDQLVLWGFLVEAVLKLFAHSPQPLRYFRDPWNVFDFTIVVVCFLPYTGLIPDDAHYVQIFRMARLARTIRLLEAFPELQRLAATLLNSLKSIFYISLLLLLCFYVFGVLGVFLFRENDPVHFGNLGRSMLSLFRVVTMEDWTDIMYTQIWGSEVYTYEAQGIHGIPEGGVDRVSSASPVIAVTYFISVILVIAMVVFNLFIAVIVSAMSSEEDSEAKAKLDRVTSQVRELQEVLGLDRSDDHQPE